MKDISVLGLLAVPVTDNGISVKIDRNASAGDCFVKAVVLPVLAKHHTGVFSAAGKGAGSVPCLLGFIIGLCVRHTSVFIKDADGAGTISSLY